VTLNTLVYINTRAMKENLRNNLFMKLACLLTLITCLGSVSVAQNISLSAELKSGLQFYNFNSGQIKQNLNYPLVGLLSVSMRHKNFDLVVSSGYGYETKNFDFHYTYNQNSYITKYKFSTTSIPILIGVNLVKYKLQPGIRTGVYINQHRTGSYTELVDNYSTKHTLNLTDLNAPTSYYIGLLVKYQILNRLCLKMEADYQQSGDYQSEYLPELFNPTSKFEIGIGLEYTIFK
jgi:hypothetical protein